MAESQQTYRDKATVSVQKTSVSRHVDVVVAYVHEYVEYYLGGPLYNR